MAILTIASKTDDTLILPAMLAAAYTTQNNAHGGINIEYKDVVSLGEKNEKVLLTMDNGDVVVDGSVLPYLVDQRGADKNEVCCSFPIPYQQCSKLSHYY